MASSTVDRRLGLNGGTAIKAPVACATTANITLSGEQTIDGVLTSSSDVLVKNQTSGVDNGIYTSDSGTWSRRTDADGSNDLVSGTLVKVNGGTTNSGLWYLSTTGTITPGTTSLTFASAQIGIALVSAFMQTLLNAADATTAFSLLAAAGLSLTGAITPTILAANTDNWAPTGFATASTVRVSSSSAINLTGIAAGANGRLICLHNVGAFAITLKNAVTSTAANQFQLSGDYVLSANASVALEYDPTSSKWRIFGQQGTQASVSFNRLVNNVGLSVTMAASAATIALKDATGADPSAASPCTINIRSGTLTLGQVNQRTVQAALSVAISSGSTAGSISANASRIWIAAIDAGGTIELAWFNALTTSTTSPTINPINENTVISTTAEGGAGAADSAGIWYSTTARSNVAFTVLGYFESTQATAGTWATAASAIAVNPEARPGRVVQQIYAPNGGVTNATTQIPQDDTIPQVTEGTQISSQSITPSSAANILECETLNYLGVNGSGIAVATSMFVDGAANAVVAGNMRVSASTAAPGPIPMRHQRLAGGTAAVAFTVRAGNDDASTTWTWNGGGAGVRKFGGVMSSYICVRELMA